MPNTTLTKAKILDEVLTMLGGTAVDVELIDKDVAKCTADAFRVYNHNLPMRSRQAIPATNAQTRYVLNHPNLEGVTEVEFVPNNQFLGGVDPFDIFGRSLGQTLQAAPGVSYGDVFQQQMYIKDARRISSTEPEWFGQWEYTMTPAEYALYIYVAPSTNYHVAYTYAWHLSPDDNAQTGMQLAPSEDVDWIMDYTLARAKQILARKLGKFQGITNPDGATDPTDAENLRSEGREDQQRLEEEMKRRRRPLLPLVD